MYIYIVIGLWLLVLVYLHGVHFFFFTVLISCVVATLIGSSKDIIGYIFTTEE